MVSCRQAGRQAGRQGGREETSEQGISKSSEIDLAASSPDISSAVAIGLLCGTERNTLGEGTAKMASTVAERKTEQQRTAQ